MSSWDAPTGNWDSRPEPDDAGGPGEQGYQQGEPGGGHHARGDQDRLRAGRRALPGYDQAQNSDTGAGAYDQGAGYGQGSGSGQSGSGQSGYGQSGYGQQPVYDPVSGYGPSTAPQPSFGSGSTGGYGADSPGSGGGPQRGYSSGPQRSAGQGRGEVDPLTAPGPFSSP